VTDESRTSASDVFVNCPFDAKYKPIFEALVFTIFVCEFRPRSALELDDASLPRIEKLYAIVESCRYAIHDLSRTELDPENHLPRFNMPLELGIFLGAKKFGDESQRQKRCLILDVDRYRYQKFVSDLAGMDIYSHGDNANQAITCARDWLANVSRRNLPGGKFIQEAYAKFLSRKPLIARGMGFEPDAVPYMDYERMVTLWLLEAGAPPIARSRRGKKRK
jgi:hypothetical protein